MSERKTGIQNQDKMIAKRFSKWKKNSLFSMVFNRYLLLKKSFYFGYSR